MQNITCGECKLGCKETIIKNLYFIRCPFDNKYYKHSDDNCNHIKDYYEHCNQIDTDDT